MDQFKLVSDYKPTGDQPEAIAKLVDGLKKGYHEQALLGVTGSGKTFTMANVIAQMNKPTLVLAHNKVLAAQLCNEFREFFPENAVEFFVSYYDYYQPESYIPTTDTYIEKDSSVNDEIDRLRHSATSALSERRDIIIVASVSCIYSMGDPIDYRNMVLSLRPGMEKSRDEVIKKLAEIQYSRSDIEFARNTFRVRGDVVEVFTSYSKETVIRIEFFGDEIDRISEINYVTGELKAVLNHIAIYPASHYIVPEQKMGRAMDEIQDELRERIQYFQQNNKLIEAQRIEQRVSYDMEMLMECGFCPGIENYSRVLSGRAPGTPPFTLINYFPEDFLLVMCKRFRLFIDKFFDSFRCCNDSFNRVAALYGIDHGSMLQFLKKMKIIHLSDFTFSSQVIDNTGNFKQICRKAVCKELIIKTMHYCPSHQIYCIIFS